ncbi:amino acid adenylation domain-containing protein [Streptomyces sp. NPDC048507]|uniref:non-ribosomal peptide synthetase/type I polyketide synthase n=1 Tax=Streptomyces sp. NPDC048507 TaxID=3365560 RepID=UPI003718B77F
MPAHARTSPPVTPATPPEKVAVIGIGCRFPGGANDHRSFWRNLIEGRDCITPTPADRYDVAGLGSRDKAKPGRLVGGRGGYIDGFDEFDPAFFGISPREAHAMDPQQRKLLEVAWEALEDGGQKPAELAGRDVGVFVGAFTLDYKILQFSDLRFDTLEAHTATGTMMTMVSNRLSHCFDFRGPSLSIDSACSSSLVAVHLACGSLRRGESSLALAGGTLLHLTPQYTIAETKGGFLSPEGRSRTFDAAADGYVRAEGVGIVALKLLADAVRDGDPIHAVITETGVNQDGRTNGITVPSADAQSALIEQVCARAGITPGSLQYVEAHGTSTPVGDPVEANALARALAVGREPGAACYVGSVKTNIGHTESAAGIAGLIKTALSLEHRLIPPHINLERVNPAIDLDAAPYGIPDRVTPWPPHEGPARAGVNSFGFGGTNAHVLLEEAPAPAPEPAPAAPGLPGRDLAGGLQFRVLPLSAHDASVLPDLAGAVRSRLAEPVSLTDLAHSLARRRQHHDARLSVVYRSREDLDEALAAYGRGEEHPRVLLGRRREGQQPAPAWVFTGMGPQWWAMGRELFESSPVYRAAVEAVDREVVAQAGWSLTAELNAAEDASRMAQTWLAQPANFAVQVGLAALWHAHGVHPSAVVGHSTGEIAAFYEAGVYSLPDAVRIALHRSRLQHRLAGTGTMLAVGLPEDEASRRAEPFGDRLSVAAVNSPGALTLAGERAALVEYARGLQADGVFAKFLDVQVPYHSAGMEEIRAELLTELAGIEPRPARLPLYLTGREGRAEGPELDADYWWDNVRHTVRFRAAVSAMIDDGHRTFLEIGPHPVLGHSVKECSAARGGDPAGAAGGPHQTVTTLPSIRRAEDEALRFTTSLASLYALGCAVDWEVLHPRGRRVPLPRYPWKRDRYWTEPAPVAQVRLGRVDHPLLGRRLATAEPAWEVALDVETTPYLADHRIQGRTLFPAAGYVEMAYQAVRALTGAADAELGNIELLKALFLPDDAPRAVQLSLSAQSSAFTVATEGDAPAVHARGVVRGGAPAGRGAPLDAGAVRARADRRLDAAACYGTLSALGYEYGPAFRGIAEVWRTRGEALALIRPPASAGGAAGHHVHPVLLDSCFQALLVAGLPDGVPDGVADADAPGQPGPGGGMLLPLGIDAVRTVPIGDRPLWAHATVTRRAQDELVGDIALYTEDGEPLGHVRGFRAADVERASATVGVPTIDGWLAELTWTQAPPEADGARGEADPAPGGDWLLFADRPGAVADRLAALAATGGARCHLVRPGDGYAFGRDGHPSRVVPGSADDLRRLLADLAAEGASPGTVVHLWNLDLPALADTGRAHLGAHGTLGAYSVVALAQALQDDPGQRSAPAALHLVTRGAQAAVPGEPVEPLGAPVWGIGRVLRHQELTAHGGKLIDLPLPAADAGAQDAGTEDAGAQDAGAGDAGAVADAEALLREILAPPAPGRPQDEVALRGGRRLISGLSRPEGLTRPFPPRLRPDGAYLVTGAFGALGRLLCRYLVDRGARHLILVGRTELPDRATWRSLGQDSPASSPVGFVKELEALGAHPVHAALDICDEHAMTRWLAAYRDRDAPPVRGVFHLAGHVRDTPVRAVDRATFDAVFDPKAAGAWLLHHHLRDEPLDHFVLFASVASLLTTTGQSNYAAGNAFLDALAHHRRARGMPALSLDWGPWATGMIEELSLVEHYRAVRGMSSLSPGAGTAVLERVLGQDRAQLVIATIVDWKTFLAWYPSPPPLVAELAAEAAAAAAGQAATGTGGDGGQGDYLDRFRAAAGEEERAGLVAELFLGCASAVLRMSTDRLDPDAGLGAHGIDSLLAMELRARIQAATGIALPVVALLSGAPLRELTAQLHAATAELAARAAAPDAPAGVEVHTDPSRHPLTQNQKALWFLKQLHPDGFAYNIGGAVEVRTAIDPELMTAAVRVLVERHPVLRANFTMEDGRPLQTVSAAVEPDTAVFDVEGLAWEEIRELIVEEYRRPYDLAHDRLMRFRLFRRGPDRWVLMKAVHHIVSDAISTFTFIEELLALYEGMRTGRPVVLPPVRGRYVDFLNRQNRFLASPEADRMLEYWRGALPAEVPPLSLHTDTPRPLVQTHNGASEFFVLDEDLSGRVHALAREHDVTVFMVLLCAYYLLLHRHSGQDDVVVGSAVTGRTDEDLASVYGYFVNPLPLYADLAGDPTVAGLLAQVRETVLGGIDHQEYPFVLLVEKLGLQHDPSRSAVFQAMFILLAHKVSSEQYGYHLDYIELPEEEGQFDLTLSAYEDEAERRFHCVLKYNTDLFRPETARRLAGHYRNLLDALTRAPGGRPVSGLDMLGADERHAILHGPSARGALLPPEAPVHHLFARAAARTPDAVAVTVPVAGTRAAARHMTYAELERASGVLAGRLRARGAAGGVVAVCLPKSPELIVALLAVLRAGAAYLPLDPDHPAERLAFMAGNAAACLVLTDPAGAGRLEVPGAGFLTDVMARDPGAAPAGAAPGEEAPGAPGEEAPVGPDAPAYVIHTSGSTGRPKAVVVSHGALSALCAAWREEYGPQAGPGVHLQLAGVAFDVFTGDLVRALCSGGRLVLADRELLLNTARLYEAMTAEGVDRAEFVPAVVRALMTHCEEGGHRLDFMRLLIVGSDTWKVAEYERLRALCGPGTRVVNSYGLTEATVDSACFDGPADGLDPNGTVPIGTPLPNCVLHVLDAHRQPVPAGVTGELWAGGAGLALGYAGDPEQTGRRFVDVTLDRGPGAVPERLYRTGDLARRDARGRIHLAGRADAQIKLRGHRIEPGEIESLLTALPGVAGACALVRTDSRGEPVLCAYVVRAPGTDPDTRALRHHLAAHLPTYLIPAHLETLDALPLTPNGKVDPDALPAPRAAAGQEGHEPPVTLYEERVAAHWKAVIGLAHIGLRSDFFDSGGSSITLIELIHRLQQEFGIAIPVGRLFKVTTLHGMARTVEDIVTGRVSGSLSHLTFNTGRGPVLFCFPPAGGHGLVYRHFAAHLGAYELVAFNHVDGDKRTRYADLVESLLPEGPCHLLGYSLGGNLAFEVAKELEGRGRDVAHVVIMDSYRIEEEYGIATEHTEAFERELRDHLRRHTNSETVTAQTLEQARDYLEYCGRTPNHGAVSATVTVICDEAKAEFYAAGRRGSWHTASTTVSRLVRGAGLHAEMLDEKPAGRNAALVASALDDGPATPRRERPAAPRHDDSTDGVPDGA